MTLDGAKRLDKAIAKHEAELNDGTTARVAGELVLRTARGGSRSKRVRRAGRVRVRRGRATVEFAGANAPPFTAASHFGHGSPSRPRPQGGWMPRNEFLFDAAARHEEDIVDFYLTRNADLIRTLY